MKLPHPSAQVLVPHSKVSPSSISKSQKKDWIGSRAGKKGNVAGQGAKKNFCESSAEAELTPNLLGPKLHYANAFLPAPTQPSQKQLDSELVS